MSKVSVDTILDRISECEADPPIILDMNLDYEVIFHVYSRIEETRLKGSSSVPKFSR